MRNSTLLCAVLFSHYLGAQSPEEPQQPLELQNPQPTPDSAPPLFLKQEKNGFFIGIEGAFGMSYYNRVSEAPALIMSQNPPFLDVGILGGYQHYFDESASHGIQVALRFVSGLGYGSEFQNTYMDHDHNNNGPIREYERHASHTFIPLKMGVEVQYLWDFFQRPLHVLGLNVGLGYEAGVYWSDFEAFDSKVPDLPLIAKSVFLLQGAYPLIGLHYLYQSHHQFACNYRFGGILGMVSAPQDLLDVASFNLSTQSFFALSYAYKF